MPSLDHAHGGFFSRLVTRVVEYGDGTTRDSSGDFFTTEHKTGVKWVDGLPIYRTVELLVGGNNTSSQTFAELANHISSLTLARWAGRDTSAGILRFMRGNNAGVDVTIATGLVVVQHQTFDFTGEIVGVILEYTRLQDLP